MTNKIIYIADHILEHGTFLHKKSAQDSKKPTEFLIDSDNL